MKQPANASIHWGIRVVVIVATAFAMVSHPVAARAQEGGNGTGRPNVIVVRLNPASDVSIDDINRSYNTVTVRQAGRINGAYAVKTQNSDTAEWLVKGMKRDPRMLYAELDLTSDSTTANPQRLGAWGTQAPPEYLGQASVTDLGLPQAHAITRGAGMVVAVIDTGVQLDHPGLAGSLVQGWDFVDNDDVPADVMDGLDNNGDTRIDEVYGHGTHIAGIIHLVAPDAKIMPLRVLDADGNGYVVDVADSIAYAIQNGANVINVSLGTPQPSSLLRDVVQDAASRGVLIVGAAGNLNRNRPQYPGADKCAVAVAALSTSEMRAQFSSFGNWVDFSAPGEGIYSTFPVSEFAYWSGTSMAAPFVSGEAALILSIAPQLSVRDVVQAMRSTVTAIRKKPGPENVKTRQSGGLVNIGAGVHRVASGQVVPSGPIDVKGNCIK